MQLSALKLEALYLRNETFFGAQMSDVATSVDSFSTQINITSYVGVEEAVSNFYITLQNWTKEYHTDAVQRDCQVTTATLLYTIGAFQHLYSIQVEKL